MSTQTVQQEAAEFAVRAGPAVATTGMHFFGYSITDWVQAAVLLYTALQIGWFIYSRVKAAKSKANGS